VFLLSLFYFAGAFSAKRDGAHDVVAFIEGFATGVESEIGNVTECTKDLDITLNDFEVGFSLIKRGISRIWIPDVEKGLRYFGNGLKEVALVLKVCNATRLAEDIADIAMELSQGIKGVVEIIAKEILNIFHHGADITSDFKAAIASWEKRDYFKSGFYTGKIVGILLDI